MGNLSAKYKKLKTMVGGNREKFSFEFSFGMPKENFWHTTMPNSHIRRILAETEFAIRLSKQLDGVYDSAVEAAIDFMQTQMDVEGVLSKKTCEEAEVFLLPLAEEAKEYSLILAAHAHIDMNWMWSWHETVASTIATFQTMIKLLEEYEDFCFSQSQGSVYKIIDEYAPELKEKIMKYIKEGRWEVTASAWVETDKNMPSTESLLNHIYYTKKYMKEHWGIDPEKLEIDFSPDTFGHSANLPELDALGGVKYYYHCRGLNGDNALYRWKSPSGKEMLVYREQYWYNSGITPDIGIGLIDISNRSGGLKTGLIVYGVGDHGGGPTRRDLERALEMQEWPIFPAIRFGTFQEFFKEGESVREKLPVVDHELNFVMPGCYTTQSRIKMANRRTEAALYDAEVWDTFAKCKGVSKSNEAQFEEAWQKVLFTHFHDILTGSCVQDSREHAMAEFSNASAIAESRNSFALQGIADLIDTSDIQIDSCKDNQADGAGVGYGVEHFTGVPSPERGQGLTRIYHLFNSSSTCREHPNEITVWDWVGDMREISFTGADGQELKFQLLDESLQNYWDHKYFRVLVYAKIPAFGYTTIVMGEKEPEEYRFYYHPQNRNPRPTDDIILENKWIKATFSSMNGEIISLIDQITGKETIIGGESGGLRYIETEKSSSSAWDIGRYESISGPLKTLEIKILEFPDCALRKGFVVIQTVKSSRATTLITLDENSKALSMDVTIDWHEVTEEMVPMMVYRLPVEGKDDYLYDVPGGAQKRKALHMDVPGLQYGASIDGEHAVVIIADSKYGYRGTGDSLSCTLINATYSPDPYPERGIHKLKLAVALIKNDPKEIEEFAICLNHPVSYQSGYVKKGLLKKQGSFLETNLGTAVISGIRIQEGFVFMRLFETCGENTVVIVTSKLFDLSNTTFCDLMGNITDGNIDKVDDGIRFTIPSNNSVVLKFSI